MSKVQITYFGRQVLVDDDQVTLLLEKESLVNEAVALQDKNNTTQNPVLVADRLDLVMRKISRVNRKIRGNVQFL